MTWHLYKEHGVRPDIRRLVETTVCIACMSDFFSRERLIRHVARCSPRCHEVYVLTQVQVNDDTLSHLEAEALANTKSLKTQGHRRELATKPPLRLRGPLLLEAYENDIDFVKLLKFAGNKLFTSRAVRAPIHPHA